MVKYSIRLLEDLLKNGSTNETRKKRRSVAFTELVRFFLFFILEIAKILSGKKIKGPE